MKKKIVFFILCVLCALDNILTETLLSSDRFMEASPFSALALNLPYGLWIWKAFILSLMWVFRKKMSIQFLSIVTSLEFLVVCWNSYLFFYVS